MTNPQRYSQEHLMQVFDFSPEDLQANIDGYLTERQHRKLKAQYSPFSLSLFLVVLGAGGLVCAAEYFTILYGLFCVMVLVFIFGMGFVNWLELKRDLEQNEVGITCGNIAKSMMGYSNGMDWAAQRSPRAAQFIMINHNRFYVNRIQYEAMLDGDPYCFYYTPSTRYILSVTPMRAVAPDFFLS